MESFSWNINFETGLYNVDRQHQRLLEITNQFSNLLTANKVIFNDIDIIFKKLADYTVYHFQEEEKLMTDVGIDNRHLYDHIKIHRNFVNEVTTMHSALSRENLDSAKHLLYFLSHWLVYHILGSDQNMGRQIAAIKLGADPKMAYEDEEREADNATELLLVALNGLFDQVSAKNKELLTLNQSLEGKVAKRTKELSEANYKLEELSLTDGLTGLPNRRHAMRCLSTLWEESIQSGLPLVCIMIDADHFKEVNDTYGHDVGDTVLKELAKTLLHSFRSDDTVCRLGGDEFFAICPNTNKEGGMHIAELARKAVSELRVPTGDNKHWHGSISLGFASRTSYLKSYEALIKAADNGVYVAKQDGKNCVREQRE